MQVVAKIYVGHKIITDSDVFEVLGSMKMRSGYKYVCRNRAGAKVSLDREDVLQAQRDGDVRVSS